jgi:hypothetical protein
VVNQAALLVTGALNQILAWLINYLVYNNQNGKPKKIKKPLIRLFKQHLFFSEIDIRAYSKLK